MLKDALARRYAQALFEVAENHSFDQIEKELNEVIQFAQTEEVNYVLNHPHISQTDKKATMDKLMEGQWGEIMRNFVFLLIDHRRQDLLPFIQKIFGKMADKKRGIVEAKLISAAPLAAEQEQEIEKALTAKTGKSIRVIKEVRPELIGGLLLQIGDQVMDGTVAHALKKIRQDLQKESGYEPQEVGVN